MSLPPVAPLAGLSDRMCAALRERCAAAGYTDQIVAEMEGIAPGMFGRDVRPLIHHVLSRRGDAASSLARLLAYGDALGESLVRDLLGDLLVDALLDTGLLLREEASDGAPRTRLDTGLLVSEEASDGALRTRFELKPFQGLLLLADDPTGGRDAVMPPAGTTQQVAQLMPAQGYGSVLDVGCGPGSLALIAASRGAQRVVATDINPRAIELAQFNARLNDLDAEFLVGDLVEPVRGSRFDLVLSQPPFVIQPPDAQAVTFLHGGPSGEEIALRLLAELPSVLAPGGRALVLMEAVSRPDEALHSRMRPVLGDAPVDLLVLAAPGPPPAIQVIAYATLEVPDGGPEYPAAARRYLQQLDRLHAAEFQLAVVVLRARTAGDSGSRKLAATVPVGAIGRGDNAALERLLAAVDLAALEDPTLVGRAVSASTHVRWIEERPRPEATLEPARSVQFGSGSFGSDLSLSAERYLMASILDRAESIGTAIEQYAAAVGGSRAQVQRGVFGFVREGLMRGLFEPRPINPAVTSD